MTRNLQEILSGHSGKIKITSKLIVGYQKSKKKYKKQKTTCILNDAGRYFIKIKVKKLSSFIKTFKSLIYTTLPTLITSSRSSASVKIRYAYIRRSIQLKSIYQDIDDAPEANHHEEADDAINHQVSHLVSPFLILPRRDIFQNSIKKKHHRQGDKQNNHLTKNVHHYGKKIPQSASAGTSPAVPISVSPGACSVINVYPPGRVRQQDEPSRN